MGSALVWLEVRGLSEGSDAAGGRGVRGKGRAGYREREILGRRAWVEPSFIGSVAGEGQTVCARGA